MSEKQLLQRSKKLDNGGVTVASTVAMCLQDLHVISGGGNSKRKGNRNARLDCTERPTFWFRIPVVTALLNKMLP